MTVQAVLVREGPMIGCWIRRLPDASTEAGKRDAEILAGRLRALQCAYFGTADIGPDYPRLAPHLADEPTWARLLLMVVADQAEIWSVPG